MTDVLDHDIPGLTRPSSPGGRPDFLSDVVVELGFASRETVEQAVREARAGTTVSTVLLDSGAVNEDQLARATAERYGLDHIDLSVFPVDPGAANLIKPTAARRYLAVPVGFEPDGSLVVAVADPADVLGMNDIAVMTKLDVVAAVAARSSLEQLVERLPLTPGGGSSSAPAPPPRRRLAASAPERAAASVPTGPIPVPPAPHAISATPAPAAHTVAPAHGATASGHHTPSKTPPPGTPEVAPSDASGYGEQPAAQPPHGVAPPGSYPPAPPAPPSPYAAAGPTVVPPPSGPTPIAPPPSPAPPAPGDLPPAASSASDVESLYEELNAERAAREELERRAVTAERRLVEATRTSGEGDRRLGDAQATAEEARKRARELADADRRAEHARVALAELREETDRQREQHAQIERELRTRVASEERRRRVLEERLSEVEESVFAAERSFDELGLAQRRMRGALRALVEPDALDED